eukprot:11949533-Alexandrium_andersonii.AAC.1
MSASLVGSEMCIRDSLSVLRRRREGVALPLEDGVRDLGPRVALHWEEAVSYTHLTLPTICSV